MKSLMTLILTILFPFGIYPQNIDELKKNVEEHKNAASWNALAAYYNERRHRLLPGLFREGLHFGCTRK